MQEQYFTIKDRFLERMRADYEAGMLANPVYEPYFQWMLYDADLSTLIQTMLREMADKATEKMETLDAKHPEAYKVLTKVATLEDIWKPYALYGKDKYLYAYHLVLIAKSEN